MASLHKKPQSKNWYVVFRKELTDEEKASRPGRKRTRLVWLATGTDDEFKARECLLQIEALQEVRKKRLRVQRAFKTIGIQEPEAPLIRVSLIKKLYIETAELDPENIKGQERVRVNTLQAFLDWLNKYRPEVEYLHEITPMVANQFWRWMAKDGKSPRTRNNNLSQLNVTWKTIAATAGLKTIPWAMVKRDSGGGVRLEDISIKKIQSLLWYADRMKQAPPGDTKNTGSKKDGLFTRLDKGFWSFAIRMGFYTGLREGDIATFEAGEMHREKDCVILIPNKGKRWGNKAQVVHPLDSPWLAWAPDVKGGYVWPKAAAAYNTRDGKTLSREWKRLCTAAGIEVERAAEKGERRKRAVKLVTVHSLRHTFVTQAHKNGANMEDISQVAGHSTVSMTEHYNHAPALAAAMRVAAVMPVICPAKPSAING